MSSPTFRDLLRRVRTGDGDAATQLVREYEPVLRRAIRLRLTDPGLRQLLDSSDVCQSVLTNFFTRATRGEFNLEDPEQLFALLTTMARNAVLNLARDHQAGRRDLRRRAANGAEALEVLADPGADPADIVAGRELLESVLPLLSAEERHLAEQRALGRPWAEIAAEQGSTPEALRAQLARARKRVAQQLNLEVDRG